MYGSTIPKRIVLCCAAFSSFCGFGSVIRESDNDVRFESVSVGLRDVVTADVEVRMVHLGSGTKMTSFVKTKEPQMKDPVPLWLVWEA